MLSTTLLSTMCLTSAITLVHHLYTSLVHTAQGLDAMYNQVHFSVDDIEYYAIQKKNKHAMIRHFLLLIHLSSLFVLTGYFFMDSSQVIGLTTYTTILSMVVSMFTNLNIICITPLHYIGIVFLLNTIPTTPASLLSFAVSLMLYVSHTAYESEQEINHIRVDSDNEPK